MSVGLRTGATARQRHVTMAPFVARVQQQQRAVSRQHDLGRCRGGPVSATQEAVHEGGVLVHLRGAVARAPAGREEP